MVEALVRTFLGEAGSSLLDFYLNYSLLLNGAILVYALAVVGGRRNYAAIKKQLLHVLREKHAGMLGKENRAQLLRVLEKSGFPWQAAMQTPRFPFITPPGGWLVRLKNEKTLRQLYSPEDLVDALYLEVGK